MSKLKEKKLTKTAIEVLELAKKHKVKYEETSMDKYAQKITELSGGNVEHNDEIINLLVALARKDIISRKKLINLSHQHLSELKGK